MNTLSNQSIVEKALALWGLEGAQYQLAADRENKVFRVKSGAHNFALRLHRQGYRTDQELWSELKWMEAAASGGISVPNPIQSSSGQLLHLVGGIQVDVLTWLSGATMDTALKTLTSADRANLFHRVGKTMARLHDISDVWPLPDGFVRCTWDRDGLLGDTPLWDRFWDNPALTPDDRKLFLDMRAKTNATLGKIENDLDYGLIHADLVSANVMADGDQLHLIDFDDGGFGFRLFDIATALLKNLNEPDYIKLRGSLIEGYTSIRSIDLAELDLFLLLRSATYVGWNIERMTEKGALDRNERFINTTRQLAQEFLVS